MKMLMAWVVALKGYCVETLHELSHRFTQLKGPRTRALGAKLAPKFKKAAVMGERGQLGLPTILAAFVVVIAAFVVVIVVDSMDSALGDPSNSDLHNASNDTLSGFASMVSLVEPLLLIAIAVVIISLIRRVQ